MVHLNVGILVLTSSITDQQRQKTLNDPDEEPRILSMLESRDENEEVFVFEILSMSALNELVVFLETIARSFNIELEDEGYEQIKHHLNFAA
jgi:broad-specificity NMP kinase